MADIPDASFSTLSPQMRGEIESWVVNTVKVNMIKKLDSLLMFEGKQNARKLLLVPIFTIKEIIKKVEDEAPELKTYFYKYLFDTIDRAKKMY